MAVDDPFDRYDDADIRGLIAGYPLAWMLLPDRPDILPVSLPMIGEYRDNGSLAALIGHFGRRLPIHAALLADHRARFLFRGPDGYISPEYAGVRDWAPTWNFAQAVVDAEVTVDDALTGPALDRLVAEMERDQRHPWSAAEMGPRYDRLAGAIIGFRAAVTGVAGRFKLGQDERPEVFAAIIDRHPDAALAERMAAAKDRAD